MQVLVHPRLCSFIDPLFDRSASEVTYRIYCLSFPLAIVVIVNDACKSLRPDARWFSAYFWRRLVEDTEVTDILYEIQQEAGVDDPFMNTVVITKKSE